MEVCQAVPEQQGAIAQLMRATFGQSEAFLSPEFLRWKFFSPHPASIGSRSYIVPDGEAVQAHACEWPLSFLAPSGEISSCHIIDWAALPEAKGTGLSIYQHLMAKNQTVIAIGGSAHAMRLLPKLGFRSHGTLDSFAFVARPWRQHCVRPGRTDWRAMARLARNSIWSLKSWTLSETEWTSVEISSPNDLPQGAFCNNSSSFCFGVRSASWLQYLKDCPLMNCSLFGLFKAGIARGYFLLNHLSGRCRIIDLAVDSEAPEDWEAAYRAAVLKTLEEKTTCEVTAVSSLVWLSDALRRIGFRLRKQTPVMVYDPARKLSDAPPLHLRMTDSDSCFLYDEQYPFLT